MEGHVEADGPLATGVRPQLQTALAACAAKVSCSFLGLVTSSLSVMCLASTIGFLSLDRECAVPPSRSSRSCRHGAICLTWTPPR